MWTMRCLHSKLSDKPPTSGDKNEGRGQVTPDESSVVVSEVGAMGEGRGKRKGCGVWRVVRGLRRRKKKKADENKEELHEAGKSSVEVDLWMIKLCPLNYFYDFQTFILRRPNNYFFLIVDLIKNQTNPQHQRFYKLIDTEFMF